MKVDVCFGTQQVGPSVLTMGSFDGVHLGHVQILTQVALASQDLGLQSIVASFDPHPRQVLMGSAPRLLTTVSERSELMRQLPLDVHVLLGFDKEVASMKAESFVRSVLIDRFNTRVMVVGYDHRFGRNRSGDSDLLRKMGKSLGFSVIEVPQVVVDGVTASSSSIRSLLEGGDVSQAGRLLGRPYAVQGVVVRGAGRGKSIGVPTANIGQIADNKLVPAGGVYAVRVQLVGDSQKWGGMMNIGSRPTFERNDVNTLEVNVFDLDQDLYERELRVEFVERVRDERKFGSVDELSRQLSADRERCTRLLGIIS